MNLDHIQPAPQWLKERMDAVCKTPLPPLEQIRLQLRSGEEARQRAESEHQPKAKE